MLRFGLGLALAMPFMSAAPVMAAEMPASTHQRLVSLFAEWRAFNHPVIVRGRPDYGAAAMASKAIALPSFKQRFAAIDTSDWSASQKGDYRFVEAEMNGCVMNRIQALFATPRRCSISMPSARKDLRQQWKKC